MELNLTNEILASINPHNLSNETIVQDILKKGFEKENIITVKPNENHAVKGSVMWRLFLLGELIQWITKKRQN